MKTLIIIIFIIIVAGSVIMFGDREDNKEKETGRTSVAPLTKITMNITSSAFEHNKRIPAEYTCDNENISPPLTFNDVPPQTKSLAFIMDDPDAPKGTWVHWTVWNIDPSTTEVRANSVPTGGIEGTTSFGKSGYGGPCPPSESHRYFFKLYALDTTLNLETSATEKKLERAMEGHVLDRAELIGLYSRQ